MVQRWPAVTIAVVEVQVQVVEEVQVQAAGAEVQVLGTNKGWAENCPVVGAGAQTECDDDRPVGCRRRHTMLVRLWHGGRMLMCCR